MKKSTWYQVKYNGDGNVIDVTEYNQVSSMTAGEDYVTSYSRDEILTAVNKKDTVLFHSVGEKVNTANLKLEERTLWLDGLKTKGFRVAEDVKIVLIQNNHNVENTYFESGISSLRSIISDLNDRHTGKAHDYIISAILDRNAATSIVIRDIDDTTGVNCDPYTDPNWGTNTTMTVSVSGGTVTCTVPVGGTVPTPRELRDAVLKHLGEVWNPDRGDEFSETATNMYSLKVNGMVYTVNLRRLLADTANVTFAVSTPGSITPTVNQNAKTVAVNVPNTTTSVVIDLTLAAGQTATAGGTNVDNVTSASPRFTVNTNDVSAAGGSKVFTLTIAEANKNPITYTVTVTVAGPGTPSASITITAPVGGTDTVTADESDLGTTELTVTATESGGNAITYTWKVDGTAVPAATTGTTGLDDLGIDAPGNYTVTCELTSSAVTTAVTATFTVTVKPDAPTWTDNSSTASAAGTVNVIGNANFPAGEYKLYVGGSATAAATATLAADGNTINFTGVTGLTQGTATNFAITITVNGVESDPCTAVSITPGA